jgi:DNA helicase-2/ATP-dependent DNA helicase PcrA
MGLRKGQKELVEQYRAGYSAVPAIPGGGKTYCLSLWAVEMMAQGLHKPGKILIVTYMNSAVNNFKQRISRELQKRGIQAGKDYFVSTIHGLCLQIIRE